MGGAPTAVRAFLSPVCMLRPWTLRPTRCIYGSNVCLLCQLRFPSASVQPKRGLRIRAPSVRKGKKPEREVKSEQDGPEQELPISSWRQMVNNFKSTTSAIAQAFFLEHAKDEGLLVLESRRLLRIAEGFRVAAKKDQLLPTESFMQWCSERGIKVSTLVPFAWILRTSSIFNDVDCSTLILDACARAGDCDATCLLLSEAMQDPTGIPSGKLNELRRLLIPHVRNGNPKAQLLQARMQSNAGDDHAAQHSYSNAIRAFRKDREARSAKGEPLEDAMDNPAVLGRLDLDFFDLTYPRALYEHGALFLAVSRNETSALTNFRAAAALDVPEAHLMVAAFSEHCEYWGKQWLEHVTKAAASGSKDACNFLRTYYQKNANEVPRREDDGVEEFLGDEAARREMLAEEWEMIERTHASVSQ